MAQIKAEKLQESQDIDGVLHYQVLLNKPALKAYTKKFAFVCPSKHYNYILVIIDKLTKKNY